MLRTKQQFANLTSVLAAVPASEYVINSNEERHCFIFQQVDLFSVKTLKILLWSMID